MSASSLAGVTSRLQASLAEVGPALVQQEIDDEISTYEDIVTVNAICESENGHGDDDNFIDTQDVKDIVGVEPAPVEDVKPAKRSRLADGVVEKASEQVIQPSTRRGYEL